MSNVQRFRTDDPSESVAAGAQVASWYTQGRSDGLGDRLLMFDNTNAASLELLRFRSAFAAVPEFELALRTRIAQLAHFDHPGFPAVRAVEHLDDGSGLALVSTHVPGRRLSEMFQGPQPRTGLHPAFVTWLIRQLTTSLAALQAQGEGVAHGAMSADRVIVSTDGQLLIAEHVLGSALRSLRLTPSLLLHEFGLLAPPTNLGIARLDARTDVIQLGLTALSVLLGRLITYDTYQQDLRPLIEEFSSSAQQRSPFLAPPLRLWLERALQLDAYGFCSAAEARDGLKELPETTSPRGFNEAQSSILFDRTRGDARTAARATGQSQRSGAVVTTPPTAPVATRGTPIAPRTAPSITPAAPPPAPPLAAPTATPVTAPPAASVGTSRATPTSQPAVPLPAAGRVTLEALDRPSTNWPPTTAPQSSMPTGRSQQTIEPPVPPPSSGTEAASFRRSDFSRADRPVRDFNYDPTFRAEIGVGRRTTGNWLTTAVALVALIEAGILGRLLLSGRSDAASLPPTAIPVVIESTRAGDLVIVDGRPLGTTPVTVQVDGQMGSIRVVPSDQAPVGTTSDRPAEQGSQPEADNRSGRLPQTPPRTGSGDIRLLSPIPLQVFENERFLGSTGAGPVSAPVGVHDLELVNTELGYRTYQRVTVVEGQVVPLTITPPLGHLRITAVASTQVWVDGRLAGETPLGDVTLSAGAHTITFRHPELGERIESVMVRPGAVTQLSATFR